MSSSSGSFTVGLSSDLSDGRGGFSWGDVAIETLSPLPWRFMDDCGKNFTPESVKSFDAVAFAGPGVRPGSFGDPASSPLIIARFGVGYDNIDLAECTRAGVALTITPDGSRRPVAGAALALILATMHRIHAKSSLLTRHAWNERLSIGLGDGLCGKTVGIIGLGNIATEFLRLIEPFGCQRLAYDPWKKESDVAALDVTLVSLDQLLQEADVVLVMATLTKESHHLINAERLSRMKRSSYLVNMSRGPIIDEEALIDALKQNVIAGAGLDVFEVEPPSESNPLFSMEKVVATPHNIAWTDQLAIGMGRSAFGSIKKISQGEIPDFIVNKDVIQTTQFREKLARVRNG
jgi:phosphoglycerate dehydrogenase-like enzyme